LSSPTVPNAVTQEILEQNNSAERILCELFVYDGATNDNLEEVLKTNPKNVAGIKYFRLINRKYVG
jgi:dihydroorotase